MAYIRKTRRLGTLTDQQIQNVLNTGQLPVGYSITDPLGSLAATEADAKDVFLNALPVSWGGQVLTKNELSNIQTQSAQDITTASAGNTALAQSEIAQMNAETAAVAAQAQADAEGSDDGDSTLSAWQKFEAWVQANWPWIAIGGVAFLIARPDEILFGGGRRR